MHRVKRLDRTRKISVRGDVADAILDYNSGNPEVAESTHEFLMKRGRLGTDVFRVDAHFGGGAQRGMKKEGMQPSTCPRRTS